MKYNDLCEMNIAELMSSLMGQTKAGSDNSTSQDNCVVQKPIQPNDSIGEFGNTTDIQIKVTEDGGLEVDSKEMAIKISADVFEAIKSFVKKGD